MPSIKNPNFPSKNRLAARAAKQRKQRRKAAEQARLAKLGGDAAKADAKRGARPGLLPTSGPRRALSKKKMRKLERMRGYVRRRLEEEAAGMLKEGEVIMEDAPMAGDGDGETTKKRGQQQNDAEPQGGDDAEMDVE